MQNDMEAMATDYYCKRFTMKHNRGSKWHTKNQSLANRMSWCTLAGEAWRQPLLSGEEATEMAITTTTPSTLSYQKPVHNKKDS